MNGVAAEGTTIGYGNAEAGPFTTLALVQSVKPPGGEVTEVDDWHLLSDAKATRPGQIPDPGEVTFKVMYNPSSPTHSYLHSRVSSPVTEWFKVAFNDGYTTHASSTFPGYIKSFDPDEAEGEDNLHASVTIRLTDFPTYTPGANS